MADQGNEALLRVEDLRTWYPIKKGLLRKTVGHVKAVDGVSLEIEAGKTLALVLPHLAHVVHCSQHATGHDGAPSPCRDKVFNTEHAQHAALLLRVWFLNSDTFMRPNARHAQSISPGHMSTSGGGIIDFSAARSRVAAATTSPQSASRTCWTPLQCWLGRRPRPGQQLIWPV